MNANTVAIMKTRPDIGEKTMLFHSLDNYMREEKKRTLGRSAKRISTPRLHSALI